MRRLVLPGLLLALLGTAWFALSSSDKPDPPRPEGSARTGTSSATEPATIRRRPTGPLPRFTPASGSVAETPARQERPAVRRESAVDDSVPEMHRPLYAAIRARKLSPTEKRAAMLKALADSGPAATPWSTQAPDVFAGWQRAMGELAARLSLAEPTCYRAGCAIEVRFADLATYQQASARIRTLAEPAGRHGGRVQTPPDHRPGGEVVASWIMMAPAGS